MRLASRNKDVSSASMRGSNTLTRTRRTSPMTAPVLWSTSPVGTRERAGVAQESFRGLEVVVEELVVAHAEGEPREVRDVRVGHDDGAPEVEVPDVLVEKALIQQHVDRSRRHFGKVVEDRLR